MRDQYLAVGASGRGHVSPKESGLKASTVATAAVAGAISPPTMIAPRERQFEIKNKIQTDIFS